MEIVGDLSRPKSRIFSSILPWSLITFLVLLRYLSGWLPYLVPASSQWLSPFYQIGTYTLIAVFIWLEKDYLASYHIDRLVIIFFLAFKILYPLLLPFWLGSAGSSLAFPQIPGFSFWLVAILLWLTIRTNYAKLPNLKLCNWIWLSFGCVFGILWGFVVVFLLPGWITQQDIHLSTPFVLALRFPIQMGSAAINEEPLFRAILWGQLRRTGWKEVWIWLFQAGLFSTAHGGIFLSANVIPWTLFYFSGGLAFGLIVWKSRSIAPSMLAHAVFNASSILIGVLSFKI